jgi:hypothetical protein
MGAMGEGEGEKCPYEGGARCPVTASACENCGAITPWALRFDEDTEMHFCGSACVLAMKDFIDFMRETRKESNDAVSRGNDPSRAPPVDP